MAKKTGTAFFYYIIVVVVADLAGMLAVNIFDILFGRFDSAALYYAIWLVLGVFGGVFYWGACQQASRGQYAPGDGILVISVSILLSALLIFIFYQSGEMSTTVSNYDYYVPGHKYVTYTFFISFVITALLSSNITVNKDSSTQKKTNNR